MKLDDWLQTHRYRKGKFAEMIGVTGGWVTQLCDGSGWPSRELAARIAEVTNGEVTANDFMGLQKDVKPNSEDVSSGG